MMKLTLLTYLPSLFLTQYLSLNSCAARLPEGFVSIEKLGTKREKFDSVPGCGDINGETSFTLNHVPILDVCPSACRFYSFRYSREESNVHGRDYRVLPRITFPPSSRKRATSRDSRGQIATLGLVAK